MFSNLVRAMLLAVALVLMVIGAAMFGFGVPGFAPLIWGVLLLIGVAFERWRYKRLEAAPGVGFHATAERFVDPTSGERVRVWANAATGERRYVRDDGT